MANKWSDLKAKLSPEARAEVDARVKQTLATEQLRSSTAAPASTPPPPPPPPSSPHTTASRTGPTP